MVPLAVCHAAQEDCMRKWIFRGLVLAAVLTVGAVSAHAAERSLVKMETSKGDIVIELYPDKAPRTVANFLQYVQAGAYDGTIFHRVIKGFMIQGGGFDQDMSQRPSKAPIRNEADNGLKNDRYTIAMARTGDPHSATNQFFINVVDNAFLNYKAPNPNGWGYCVFGKVVDGTSVVDAIKAVPTGNRAGQQDVPREPVVIKKAYVFKLSK